MQSKWYIELSILISVIVILVLIIWNIDFDFTVPDPITPQPTEQTYTGGVLPEKPVDNKKWTNGNKLFKMYCASCHNLKKNSVGPALVGVTARWNAAGTFKGKTGEEWMKLWIKDWRQVIASGYPYGISLKKSTPSPMVVFPMLSDKDIDEMLYYIENTYHSN